MITIMKKAAVEAGRVLLKYFHKKLTISYKNSSHKMLVTEADCEAQEIIQKVILAEMRKKGFALNDVGFIGEENLLTKGDHTFVIDPLDGTTNFAQNLPFFAVSIGYFYKGQLLAGLIYNPCSKEMFFAEKGKGAFNESGLKLQMVYKPLNECLVNGYFNSSPEIQQNQLKIYKNFLSHVRGLRNIGSIAVELGMTAENIFNLSINGHGCLWDFAAGNIIITEAGGIMVDWSGSPLALSLDQLDYQSISGHPKSVEDILKYFKV